MSRVFNFSAGPAVLPESVLREAADEMLDYHGCGMSVMEMSHRSSTFGEIIEEAESDLRELMGIPSNYKVLFLQGGGSTQFAMVPMNLMRGGHADYVVSGSWSKKAFQEAARFGGPRVIGDSSDKNFSYVPKEVESSINPSADYVYICQNETIYGTKYHELPETGEIPLVSDISSCFLSEPIDVSKYGLLYAGAQKNAGPAGVTIVIVREDLIPSEDLPGVPTMLQYKTHADAKSLYNTPPCYSIYICGKVFKWVKAQGGLQGMRDANIAKASLLYDALDSSDMFHGTACKDDRSIMNVPFVTGDKELDARFIAEAEAAGFKNIKGHRSVGGMRASIYNAMPIGGVRALVDFMRSFEERNASASRSI